MSLSNKRESNMKLKNYRVGQLSCSHCDYKMDIVIPFGLKTMNLFDEHTNACADLKRINAMDDSLKTPQIIEQIAKLKEVITLGYN